MFKATSTRVAASRPLVIKAAAALSLTLALLAAAPQAKAGLVIRADLGPVTVRVNDGRCAPALPAGDWVVARDRSCCSAARAYGGQVVLVSGHRHRHHQHMVWVPGHLTAKHRGCRTWVPGHWQRF